MRTKVNHLVAACLVLLAGAMFSSAALADPPGRVGRLSYLSGPVSFAPAGLDNEWSVAVINRPVTTGDHLWADNGARAEVHIGSTALRMAPYTNVDVLNLDDRSVQLRVAQGAVNVRVRRLGPGERFEIDTPASAVVVRRPGSYRIEVDPEGTRTTVSVRFGEVNVTGPKTSFLLYTDQSATLYSDSPNYDLTRLPPLDEFDRFSMARDRREDRVRSVRYVSYDMTGYEDLDTYGTWNTVPDYGTVWFPTAVAADWVPYRDGRWMWVEPWGWTWVDEAPWGFAPFHYGRWIYVHNRWGWYPGSIQAQPVYAPALVAFVGGAGFNLSVSIGGGPIVGWFPLGYREPYIPWYSVSPTYVRQVNIANNVTNINNITNITNVTNITNINYVNRTIPTAVTAVPGSTFTGSQPVARAVVAQATIQQIARAPIVAGGAPIAPVQQSLVVGPASTRPPQTVMTRPVVAVQTPPARPASFAVRQAEIARAPDKPFQVRPLGVAPTGRAAPTTVPGAASTPGTAPAATLARPPVRVVQPSQVPQPAVSTGPARTQQQPGVAAPAGQPQAPAQTGRASGALPATPSAPAAAARLPAVQERQEVPRPPRHDERIQPGTVPQPPAVSRPAEVQHPPQAEERVRQVVPGRAPQEAVRPPQVEERGRPSIGVPRPPAARPSEVPHPPQTESMVAPPPPAARAPEPHRPPQATERATTELAAPRVQELRPALPPQAARVQHPPQAAPAQAALPRPLQAVPTPPPQGGEAHPAAPPRPQQSKPEERDKQAERGKDKQDENHR